MKKLMVSIMLASLSLSAFAGKKEVEEVTPKLSKGAIIEEDLKLQSGTINNYRTYGSLKDIDKKKADKIRLQGSVYVRPCKEKDLKGYNIAIIQWLGVQKIDSPDKVVGFKENIVSSFMFKDGADIKNIPLPTFGDEQDLKRAISDLEQDKIDLEDLKRKRKFKVVYSNDDGGAWLASNQKNNQAKAGKDGVSANQVAINKENGINSTHDLPNDVDGSGKSRNTQAGSAISNENPFSFGNSNSGNHLPGFQANSANSGGENTRNSNGMPGLEGNDPNFKNKDKEDGKDLPTSDPNITIELTEDGCSPEHDVLQERIIITARAKKLEDGKVVDEGICERTLEIYPVKRDYLCAVCVDEVKLNEGKAYARYQEHWFDKNGARHNLGIKVDEGTPFVIHETSRECDFDTELEEGYAIEMSKLGYLNKFRGFQVIEGCRISEKSKKYPVTETAKGCEVLHDFPNNISYLQNRLVFNVKGVEHQARGCEKAEPGIEHQFTQDGCRSLVNVDDKTITKTAKRYIKVGGRTELITAVCEPLVPEALQATRKGCEGQYYHDFTRGQHGRSYFKKKYYYDTERGKKYVTGCVVTDEYLDMSTEYSGEWVHNDAAKESRPKLGVFIQCPERGKTQISEFKVRGDGGLVNYQFSQTVIENGKKVNIYYRGGGSSYREPAND